MFWRTFVTLLVTLHRAEEVKLETTRLPCSGDDCGTSPLTSPLTCFQCRHCDNVTTSHLMIECNSAACCYVAVVTDYGNQEAFAVRGCAPTNKSCYDGCQKIQLEHQLAHPNGTFGYCMTCKGNKCNVNKYIPSELVKRRVYNGVNCYECRNCNQINSTTPTVRCSQPECCYMAVLKDKLHDKNFAVRGCVKQNCSDTCKTIKDRQAHADEMFSYCMTCGDGAGDNCNGNEYSPKLIDEHNCFDCEDCEDIKLDTVEVRCGTRCCYSKIVMGKYQRGCAVDLNGGSCGDYCGMKINGLCDSCSGNNCNSLRFPNDTIVADMGDSFKCYNCKDCDTVSSNTPKMNCNTNCCATVVKTVRGVSSSYRNCVWGSCQQYCGYVAKSSKIDYCKICNGNECNGEATNQTSLFKRQAYVYCYSCSTIKDCKSISPLTAKVYCSNRCCFAKVLRGDGGSIVARRGCARLRSGCTCSGYCNKERIHHAAVHPHNSNKFYCKVCSSYACNKQELDISFRPHGILGYYTKTCYNCLNCYDINHDTETIECPDGCCYTAIWTEYRRRLLVRLCALLDGRRCEEYCGYLAERLADNTFSSSLNYCRTCCNGQCNSEPPPEYFEPIQADPKDIKCYQCDDCDTVSRSTHTVLCPSRCCYSQLKYENDGKRVTERRCAKIFPGTPCHKFCAHAEHFHRRLHPRGFVSYCKHCSILTSDTTTYKCNSEQLDTGVTGTADTPINCYVCRDCYDVGSRAQEECGTGWCYRMLQTYLGVTTLIRDCVKPDETPGPDYCDVQQIKMLYTDPTAQVDCRACSSDGCNYATFVKPTTVKPAMSCYVCPESSDCNVLTLGDTDQEVCESRCCYTILYVNNMLGYTSERGCATIPKGQSCDMIVGDWNKQYKNYTICYEHLCNFINMQTMIKAYNELEIKCYKCENITEPDKSKAGSDGCPLDTETCDSKCCYTAFRTDNSQTDKSMTRGCYTGTEWCMNSELKNYMKENKFDEKFQVCSYSNCNDWDWVKFVDITCYKCDDCDKCMDDNAANNCASKDICESKCCYSAYIVESDKMYKGCAIFDNAGKCDEPTVRQYFKTKYKDQLKKKIAKIVPCAQPDCNNKTKVDFPSINCYECEKCVLSPTETCGTGVGQCATSKSCKYHCCYTAIDKENNITRGCLKVDKCIMKHPELKEELNKIEGFAIENIHKYDVCDKDNCNNIELPFKCCNNDGTTTTTTAACQELKDCISRCCYTYTLNNTNIFKGCMSPEHFDYGKCSDNTNCDDDKFLPPEPPAKRTECKLCSSKSKCNEKT